MKTFNILFASICLTLAVSCSQTPVQTEENDSNAVIETIMARRSIRKYKAEPVPREIMDQIIKCGVNAPNAQNRQSWEIRVVDNPALLEEMKAAIAKGGPKLPPPPAPDGQQPKMAPPVQGDCFRGAPVMVFIASDTTYPFSQFDCGLMAENMVLSAWSLGVGSVCLGSAAKMLTGNEACKPYLEKLGFSEGFELSLCVGFGYADESPEAKPRDMAKVRYID